MAKNITINRMYRRILSYIGRGDPTSFILHNTRLKKSNYYKKINTLEKYGYIRKKRIGKILDIQLQPKAIKELAIVSVGAKRNEYINLHDVWVACEILIKPIGWGKKDFVEKILETKCIDYTTNKPKNWKGLYFDFASVLVRVTPNKIMFNPPQIELDMNDTPEQAKNLMLKYIKGIIPKIENWFNVTIARPNRISITLSSQHIAFVNNKMAHYFVDKKIDLKIYDEEGILRTVVDQSHGPELEYMSKAHGEDDADYMKTFIEDTTLGRFNHRQVGNDLATASNIINKLAQNQESFSNDMVEYGQKISLHLHAIEQLGDGVTKLTNIVERIDEKTNTQPKQKCGNCNSIKLLIITTPKKEKGNLYCLNCGFINKKTI